MIGGTITEIRGVEYVVLDQIFSVLSDRHRRQLLLGLLRYDSLTRRDDREIRAVDDATDPRKLRTEMRHVHLPKLEEAGFIEWERAAETVARGPAFDRIEPVLRGVAEPIKASSDYRPTKLYVGHRSE